MVQISRPTPSSISCEISTKTSCCCCCFGEYRKTFVLIASLIALLYYHYQYDFLLASGVGHHSKGTLTICPEKPRRLVILNLGHGTTATHAFFYATCALGIPGVHYFESCSMKAASKNIQRLKQPKAFQLAVPFHKFHTEAKDLYIDIVHCVNDKDIQTTSKCSVEALEKKISTMKKLMSKVLKLGSDTFIDSPYPHFIPWMMEQLNKDNQFLPFLMLSRRDPQIWAEKRKWLAVYCKDMLLYNRTDFGTLDIDTCVQRRTKELQLRSKSRIFIKDIFTNTHQLFRYRKKDAASKKWILGLMKGAYTAHEDHVLKNYRIDYQADLFERPSKTPTVKLAKEINAAIAAKQTDACGHDKQHLSVIPEAVVEEQKKS